VVRRSVLEAELLVGRQVVAQGTAEWQTLDDLAERIARLPSEIAGVDQARKVTIEIARPLLQRRTLSDLPPLRRSALRSLVRHQSSRFFRASGGALVTDVCCRRAARRGPVEVVGVAADEAMVAAMVGAVESTGTAVYQVRPHREEDLPGTDLLPPASRARRHAARRRHWQRGVAISAALIGVVITTRAVAVVREQRSVAAAVDSLRAPLEALGRLRREMARTEAMLNAIDGSVRNRGVITHRLLRMVQALPDSAALTTIHLDMHGEGRVTGLARRPLDVVADLERGQAAANPRLEGGTIREEVQGRAWERFTIGFGSRSGR